MAPGFKAIRLLPSATVIDVLRLQTFLFTPDSELSLLLLDKEEKCACGMSLRGLRK